MVATVTVKVGLNPELASTLFADRPAAKIPGVMTLDLMKFAEGSRPKRHSVSAKNDDDEAAAAEEDDWGPIC